MFKINRNDSDLDYWLYLIKTSAVKAYNNIKDIIGTSFAREKLSQGAAGDTTLKIDKMAEDIIMDTLKSSKFPFKLITEEFGEMEFIPPNSQSKLWGA